MASESYPRHQLKSDAALQMSGRDEPTVRVRISHRSQQQYQPPAERDPAVAFWQEVLNEPAIDVRGLERRFEIRFGPAFKRHLPVSSFIPTTYNFEKLPVEVLVQSRQRQVAAEELIIEARSSDTEVWRLS
jgi:hypothetical protein